MGTLSGGERNRVQMAKMLARGGSSTSPPTTSTCPRCGSSR
jgi:ABC-type hemin transport system ATPase subunit